MKSFTLLFALTACLPLSMSAHAQQCDPGQGLMTTYTSVVTPSGSCTCAVYVPWGAPYAPYFPGTVLCCGVQITSFSYAPQLCQEGAVTHDAALIKAAAEAELKTGEQFLIADCRGNLVPFEPSPELSFAAKVARTDRIQLR
jgi:hypothetical protein